ncbi:MAG: hypothetical protein IJY42_04160 [Clostridia bacterium]|nr:hypothetical protein [Clostridia bacterium]
MENNQRKEEFQYTYSAKEQEELKRIRERYTERTETPIERLRRLDRSATKRAQAVSILLGVIGTLVLGVGMSLAMSEFSTILGAYEGMAMPLGIVIGLIGCLLVCLAYPAYHSVLKRARRKIAPEVIRLTDELIQ